MELKVFYEDYWRNKTVEFDEETIWKANILLAVIPKNNFSVVAELGCGTGGVLNLVADKVGATQRIGLEISREALKLAKGNYPKISCIQADVTKLPLNDGSLDLVILSDILEHVPKPVELLKSVSKITKFIALDIPIERSFIPKLLERFKGTGNLVKKGKHPAGHLFEWTKKDVEQLFRGLNIRIISSILTRPPKEFFRSSGNKGQRGVLSRLSESSLVNLERMSSALSNDFHARLFHAKYFAFAECGNSI